MLTEPVTCAYCGAVSVNGGKVACNGCHEEALAEVRRLREAIEEHVHESRLIFWSASGMERIVEYARINEAASTRLWKSLEEPPCPSPTKDEAGH